MKTLLGTEIPTTARAVFYVCFYHYDKAKLNIVKEVICGTRSEGTYLYCETPNPESQLADGNTYDELVSNLELLHKRMTNDKWQRELADYL